jgi:L-threonylcarbamoyladenylate synthase
VTPSRILMQNDPQVWDVIRGLASKDPLLVTPTDTIYGFCTPYNSQKGMERIRTLKGLNRSTFITLIRNAEDFALLSRATEEQARVALRHWPGPYTFIVPALEPGATVALRMPRHAFLERLIDTMGGPVLSTSCNIHGLPPAADIPSAFRTFGDDVDLYVDGGSVPQQIPSTLVDLTGPQPKVLRTGAGTFP